MSPWPVVGIGLWLMLGFIAAGWRYAYFQRRYVELADRHRAADTYEAWLAVLGGLVSFLTCLLTYSGGRMYCHGWLLPGRKP